MSSSATPAGYSTVSPYLIVPNAAATIDFVVQVLGGQEVRRMEADGRVRHAEVRVGDSVVMIADSMPGWPAGSAHVHVYVADVDDSYARALERGAESVQEPTQKDDEDRRSGVRDAGGTTWWIATRVGEPG